MRNRQLVCIPAWSSVVCYSDLTLSIDSPANVATPPDAACVAVPDKAPPDGLVPIASVTFPVNPVAVFPLASSAVTCTAGRSAAHTAELHSRLHIASRLALPAVILNAA